MSAATVGLTIVWLIIIAVLVVIGVYLVNWLYRRSSAELAFVRTGWGGQKVVLDGGAFVVPIIHDVIPVNLNTLRLEVRRGREQSLITRNRMRVDVLAEFYLRVQATVPAIARASQTLGKRTLQPDSLKELVEGRFVDALRSVAAAMTMEELHEQRGEFVKRVREAVSEDLLRSGLELEAVSLTGMDQTAMEFFNPSNAFDAEGLTRLTEEIEQRKKIRNDIEQDTLIQIRNKNLETEKLSLDIDRDSEYARLDQNRELELRRVAQTTELAQQRAQQEQTAEAARIQARQGTETARINADYALSEARIQRERDTERLEIQRRQALELAEQDRAIAIANKSREQSEAQAEAELTRAQAVTAEEKVFTAREVEIAERARRIDIVAAEQQAEREGVQIRMAAAAEKAAAQDRAEARRLDAEGEAEAEKIRALAAKIRHEVEAEGMRLMNEAQNVLSDESRVSNLRLQLVERLEAIIRESVKPMERIEGIKILQVDGLGGAPAHGGNGESNGNGNLADSMVNSALRYRAQAPLIDTLLREVGLSGGGLQELGSLFGETPKRPAESRGSMTHDGASAD